MPRLSADKIGAIIGKLFITLAFVLWFHSLLWKGQFRSFPKFTSILPSISLRATDGRLIQVPTSKTRSTPANPNDVIVLDAGVTYVGNFTLPVKTNPNQHPRYISSGLVEAHVLVRFLASALAKNNQVAPV